MFRTNCAKHANKSLTIVSLVQMDHNVQSVTVVKMQLNIQMGIVTCVMLNFAKLVVKIIIVRRVFLGMRQ